MRVFFKHFKFFGVLLLIFGGCTKAVLDPSRCEEFNLVAQGLEFEIDLEAKNVSDNQAFPYVKCLADNGVKFAQYWAGMFYLNGNGTPQDYEQAVKYLRWASKSETGTETIRVQGQGGSIDFVQEYQTDVPQNAIPDAQYELALLYRNGTGVKQSRSRAINYLSLAADQGHFKAREALDEVLAEKNN